MNEHGRPLALATNRSLCVVAAVNDEAVLRRNLVASPMIARTPLHLERGALSASIAYNRGLDATDADIVIFAHQDVYFPAGWDTALHATLAWLDAEAPDWAVLGVFGVAAASGGRIGWVWSSGLGRVIGAPLTAPVRAQSVDELVIVLRREAGLRFDEALPHFHLYGTDIVQTALRQGRSAFVASLPVVHNSRFVPSLRGGFAEAYRHMRRKWRDRLPIETPVSRLTRIGFPLVMLELRMMRSRRARAARAVSSTTDPQEIAMRCGWENLARFRDA